MSPVIVVVLGVVVVALLGVNGFFAWDRYGNATPASPPATTTVTLTVTATPTVSTEDRDLIRDLSPLSFRDCGPESGEEWLGVDGVVAVVSCEPLDPGATSVVSLRFGTRSTMDDFMVPSYPLGQTNDCWEGGYSSTWYWDEDEDDTRGDLNCRELANGAQLSFSVYSTRIVFVAEGPDLQALYDWWQVVEIPDER